MLQQGWDKRPGVRIVFARWQDCLPQLGSFDGIFFDTFSGSRNTDWMMPAPLRDCS